jgi:hypothetical protein
MEIHPFFSSTSLEWFLFLEPAHAATAGIAV